MGMFIVQWGTTCASCGGRIEKDEEAQYAAFDEIVHAPTCPPDPTTLQRPVCPIHFTELPVSGACGDCE